MFLLGVGGNEYFFDLRAVGNTWILLVSFGRRKRCPACRMSDGLIRKSKKSTGRFLEKQSQQVDHGIPTDSV